MIILIVLVIMFVWDYFRARHFRQSGRRVYRPTAYMSNFTLRFIYEFFFEICLCVLIHTSVAYGGDTFLYFLALVIFIAIVVFIVFLFGLFCKGGPYAVPSNYDSKSLRKSWWGARPLCQEATVDVEPKLVPAIFIRQLDGKANDTNEDEELYTDRQLIKYEDN